MLFKGILSAVTFIPLIEDEQLKGDMCMGPQGHYRTYQVGQLAKMDDAYCNQRLHAGISCNRPSDSACPCMSDGLSSPSMSTIVGARSRISASSIGVFS